MKATETVCWDLANKQQRTSNIQLIPTYNKPCTGIKVYTYLKKSDPSKNPPNLTEGGVIVRLTVKN